MQQQKVIGPIEQWETYYNLLYCAQRKRKAARYLKRPRILQEEIVRRAELQGFYYLQDCLIRETICKLQPEHRKALIEGQEDPNQLAAFICDVKRLARRTRPNRKSQGTLSSTLPGDARDSTRLSGLRSLIASGSFWCVTLLYMLYGLHLYANLADEQPLSSPPTGHMEHSDISSSDRRDFHYFTFADDGRSFTYTLPPYVNELGGLSQAEAAFLTGHGFSKEAFEENIARYNPSLGNDPYLGSNLEIRMVQGAVIEYTVPEPGRNSSEIMQELLGPKENAWDLTYTQHWKRVVAYNYGLFHRLASDQGARILKGTDIEFPSGQTACLSNVSIPADSKLWLILSPKELSSRVTTNPHIDVLIAPRQDTQFTEGGMTGQARL